MNEIFIHVGQSKKSNFIRSIFHNNPHVLNIKFNFESWRRENPQKYYFFQHQDKENVWRVRMIGIDVSHIVLILFGIFK